MPTLDDLLQLPIVKTTWMKITIFYFSWESIAFSIDLPSTGVLKIQISARFNQILSQLQISTLDSKVKSSPNVLAKSVNWKLDLDFKEIPSIRVLKIQISTWFNQFLGQLQIVILNSKVKSSSWSSKRICDEMNTLLNYNNLRIPHARILNVEVWSWIN